MAVSPADDIAHMRAALALARRGEGTTWPNPSVGCVIVRNGMVVGRGRTGTGGRPHAETTALRMAGDAAQGATAYVTLEPCSHHGQTPPCADALVAAGIARVVVAASDPDPRVNGSGLARLRAAGLDVQHGLLAAEAEQVATGFLMRVRQGRPLITLKLASTLDGRIATQTGESRWITDAPARRAVHALRGQHDAVMVGVGTAVADDPDLTCRLPGYRANPAVRIVADGYLRTPLTTRLLATAARHPTWFLYRSGAEPERIRAFESCGARLIRVPGNDAGFEPEAALQALGSAGLTSVLVEGGSRLAASLLRAGLVDRLIWFHAPAVMGGDGLPAVQPFGTALLAAMPRFRRVAARPLGTDILAEFVPVTQEPA